MLKNYLPSNIYSSIDRVGLEHIQEIRLRMGHPVVVYIFGIRYYLVDTGVSKSITSSSISCTSYDIKYILDRVSNNALYSISDDLVHGFVTIAHGVRIGVSGEMVTINGVDKTIKNITSICIRIPHSIKNCSLDAYDYMVSKDRVLSTLVLSRPAGGKTTFLKDFIHQINDRCRNINILVLDERRELVDSREDLPNVDVYIPTSKRIGIESVLRSMNPSVIVLDELSLDDIGVIRYAMTSGVSIVASIHADSISDIKAKFALCGVDSIFDRYVLLKNKDGVGRVDSVFDRDYALMYL